MKTLSKPTFHKAQPIFLPKLLTTLGSYSLPAFLQDATSGLIVGIVALPLAIAFAIASGVTPERGLITAVVAGFLISALGGSRVQIGGPTGAFVVIVYNIVSQFGLNGLLLCTLMAGVILIAMGLFQLGAIIRYIPYPLTVGFTSGIAVIIFSSQIKDALGLASGPLPADFIGKWKVYFQAIPTIDPITFGLFLVSLGFIHLWQRTNRKIPGSIVAIVLITAVVKILHLPVETIGTRFGSIPMGLPHPSLPHFEFSQMRNLIGPAFTVALLGGIESLLSATVADGMIEGRHRYNTELIAQGIANIVSPLFGGIPATGAIARTATNVKNGGRTPMAGIVHALVLFLILLIFGRWVVFIPMCVLAAVLTIVSYHMSEWHAFKALLKSPRMDVIVLLSTFSLTVFVDLTTAIEVGLVLSAMLFMKRMTDVTIIREVTREIKQPIDEMALRAEADAVSRRIIPPDVKIYEAEGVLFFGVAESIRDNLDLGSLPPRVLILRMRHVWALDATGIHALRDLWKSCKKRGTHVIIAGLQPQPLRALKQAGFLSALDSLDIVKTLDEALSRAQIDSK